MVLCELDTNVNTRRQRLYIFYTGFVNGGSESLARDLRYSELCWMSWRQRSLKIMSLCFLLS
jgi:hypothetical protein